MNFLAVRREATKTALKRLWRVTLFYLISLVNHSQMVLTFKSGDKTVLGGHLNETYRRSSLFIMLHKVVQAFESVVRNLVCPHSNGF